MERCAGIPRDTLESTIVCNLDVFGGDSES